MSRMNDDLKSIFNSKWMPEPYSGCWLWTSASFTKGYGGISVSGKERLAHRVSWELHRGSIPDKMYVLHKCDTPACVNPDHLFLGTPADNNRDMVKKGRNVDNSGMNNGQSRLTDADVLAIRLDQRPQNVIARSYGVSKSSISQIKSTKLWKHL